MKYRVAILHNVVAPYRHPIFEKIFQDPRFDVVVYYCCKGHQSRRWEPFPNEYKYNYKFLSGIRIGGLSFNPTIISEIIEKRFNVVIVGGCVDITMQMAFIIEKLLNLPVILWTEGIREPKSFLGAITRPIRRLFIKEADAIIVPGRMSRNYVIGMGATKSKVFIAPNCLDNDLFISYSSRFRKVKNILKRKLGITKDKVILYVGRLIEQKGVRYLLNAFSNLKTNYNNLALVVIGSGPLKDQLKNLCKENEITDVYFVDLERSRFRYVNLIKYYSIADVFVLPTLGDLWGFVINEAMACGLPVISTKASQAAMEMVQPGGNGFIVNEAEEELYEALRKLVSSDELGSMGKRSLEIVRTNFDPKLMKEGFINAISYVLSNYRNPLQASAASMRAHSLSLDKLKEERR